jgi:hypothetical protein
MSESMNQQVLLDSRPTGEPTENNFAFVYALVQVSDDPSKP